MALSIAIETPLQDDVRVLVAELNATLLDYPDSKWSIFYEKRLTD